MAVTNASLKKQRERDFAASITQQRPGTKAPTPAQRKAMAAERAERNRILKKGYRYGGDGSHWSAKEKQAAHRMLQAHKEAGLL